jgi:hypothetical protein
MNGNGKDQVIPLNYLLPFVFFRRSERIFLQGHYLNSSRSTKLALPDFLTTVCIVYRQDAVSGITTGIKKIIDVYPGCRILISYPEKGRLKRSCRWRVQGKPVQVSVGSQEQQNKSRVSHGRCPCREHHHRSPEPLILVATMVSVLPGMITFKARD